MRVLTPDRRIIRFGLGADGVPQSYVWRMWVQGDETYLGSRALLGVTKISLHSSGHAVMTAGGSVLAINRHAVALGLLEGPRIAFPGVHFPDALPNRNDPIRKPLRLFDPPVPGFWRDFTVLIADSNFTPGNLLSRSPEDAVIVGPLTHRSGDNAWLVTFTTPMTDADVNFVNSERAKFRVHVRSDPSRVQNAVAYVAADVNPGVTVLFSIDLGRSNLVVGAGEETRRLTSG